VTLRVDYGVGEGEDALYVSVVVFRNAVRLFIVMLLVGPVVAGGP
jgi:hypothetical protein